MGPAHNTFTAGFGVNNNGQNSKEFIGPITKKRVKQIRRENGWDTYIKPISKYNEKVHASMKISFERIWRSSFICGPNDDDILFILLSLSCYFEINSSSFHLI